MEDKELIRRIFNTLFLSKNDQDEFMPRMATCGLTAKRKHRCNHNGVECIEEIVIPKMPLGPYNLLPMEPGTYLHISISVFFNTQYFIEMEDIQLDGEISLQVLFAAAKDLGKIVAMGKTYIDRKAEPAPAETDIEEFEIGGKKISVSKTGDAYKIVCDGVELPTDSKEGKEAIKRYVKAKLSFT